MENDNNRSGEAGRPPARYSPLRTLLSVAAFLGFFVAVGLSVALMSTAPWMRVSPDCSVVCVFIQDVEEFFETEG